MNDLLDIVYEYRLLLAKAEQLQIPLDDSETSRLVSLAKMLEGEAPSMEARRRMPRLPCPSMLQLTVPGGFATGEIRNISGGGLAILSRAPVVVGARTIVRITQVTAGLEYVFPCRVAWKTTDARPMIGLEFDGVPSVASYAAGGGPRGAWSQDLRFGAVRLAPIQA